MNYAAYQRDFALCLDHGVSAKRAARKLGILLRIFGAIINLRPSGADRELDRSFNLSGSAFSDALEREMLDPMLRPKWGGRA